jgi:hypothetical protein
VTGAPALRGSHTVAVSWWYVMDRDGRRAGLAAGSLRTVSTPNIALGRHRFESSDLANRAGSGWATPQLGPRYAASQVRRPATATGDFFGGRSSELGRGRRTSGAELLRRSSASRPSSTGAPGGASGQLKPPDVTAQEAVLLRSLARIEELRSGVDKMAGTQWTPRGQRVLPRRKVEPEPESEADLAALMRDLHERTMRLEDVVDDKIARRDAWLDLWDGELRGLGWERPTKTGRRALHSDTAGAYVDTPAMTGIEVSGTLANRIVAARLSALCPVCTKMRCLCDGLLPQRHDGEWRRAKHPPAAAPPTAEQDDEQPADLAGTQVRPQTGTSIASAGSAARRHPQHKTVGRRANAGLSVPYRSGRYQAVVQHRHAYTQALRGVAEVDIAKRRERTRLTQASASPNAIALVDAKVDPTFYEQPPRQPAPWRSHGVPTH